MKKLLMICVFVLMSTGAYAATMCVADDTLPIVLDPEVVGIGGGTNNVEFQEWSATFQYGALFGTVACVNTTSGPATHTLIDVDTGTVVNAGEAIGKQCWCRISHPVKSAWVYNSDASNVAYCVSVCTQRCAQTVSSSVDFRKALFNSIGD